LKTLLNLSDWPRKEHFHFFRKFDEPFFGTVVTVDCSNAYANAKLAGASFFIWYLHKTLVAVNAIETFRYRISDDQVFIYDQIDGSATISREDGSFGFSQIEFDADFETFAKNALVEIERVKNVPGLFTRTFDDDNLIHFSALPWIDFTALSHARNFTLADSCPKVSFGKMTVGADGKRTMPMSVHVHHGLIDGLHLGQFIDRFQLEMNR
jgi:chloramphenicol O-acetyltransferase type A